MHKLGEKLNKKALGTKPVLNDEQKEFLEKQKKAVELWMNNTCIDFEEDKEEKGIKRNHLECSEVLLDGGVLADDLLLVYMEHGCWAEVGRQIGLQLISLGRGCNTVSVNR
ncbi:hypothetical protein TELCIR_23498 [Teladorsagia circumcincta]|uniref:Peptidase M12A domain-containing protein n=1 Tax=Teladorsagia circumcincta TaxID=45464 RepID=A0A2G9TAX7_TELCI|nr:hypothetical protein TELCIR_23498 [Teladorsagia circumcincta]